MTGPSAIGSLKGTPSSIRLAPLPANSKTNAAVSSRLGSPIVRKGIRPPRPVSRIRANVLSIRFTRAAPFPIAPRLSPHLYHHGLKGSRERCDRDPTLWRPSLRGQSHVPTPTQE